MLMEHLTWICAGLSIAVLLIGTVLGAMSGQFQPVKPCGKEGLFRGFRRRGLAMELARDHGEVEMILGLYNQRNRTVMRQIQVVDFAFIAAYWALFLAAAAALAHRSFPWSFALGLIIVVCATAAAVFDIEENIFILKILKMPVTPAMQPWINRCRMAALIKWTLIFTVMLIASTLFLFGLRVELPRGGFFWFPGIMLAGTGAVGLLTLPFGGKVERATGLMGWAILFLVAAFGLCVWRQVPLG